MTARVSGISGKMSMKLAKAGDCRKEFGNRRRASSSNLDMKALEKIGRRNGSTKSAREAAAPKIKVFHENLLVYSIVDMFL